MNSLDLNASSALLATRKTFAT